MHQQLLFILLTIGLSITHSLQLSMFRPVIRLARGVRGCNLCFQHRNIRSLNPNNAVTEKPRESSYLRSKTVIAASSSDENDSENATTTLTPKVRVRVRG
jgi:hypothetical protein